MVRFALPVIVILVVLVVQVILVVLVVPVVLLAALVVLKHSTSSTSSTTSASSASSTSSPCCLAALVVRPVNMSQRESHCRTAMWRKRQAHCGTNAAMWFTEWIDRIRHHSHVLNFMHTQSHITILQCISMCTARISPACSFVRTFRWLWKI